MKQVRKGEKSYKTKFAPEQRRCTCTCTVQIETNLFSCFSYGLQILRFATTVSFLLPLKSGLFIYTEYLNTWIFFAIQITQWLETLFFVQEQECTKVCALWWSRLSFCYCRASNQVSRGIHYDTQWYCNVTLATLYCNVGKSGTLLYTWGHHRIRLTFLIRSSSKGLAAWLIIEWVCSAQVVVPSPVSMPMLSTVNLLKA